MPTFSYTARDSVGQSVTGTLAAAAVADVVRALRQEGKFPITIQPASASAAAAEYRGGIKISRAEVIQLSTQIAIMVDTGVTILDALECVAAQSIQPRMKALLKDVCEQVQAGIDLSAALAKHPKSFPRLYIALIKASEKSGMLPKLLNRATAYLRDEAEIVRKVRGALTYPAVMFAFAMSTTTFLLIFVLPKFTAIYASKKAALPMPTQILMGISGFLLDYWPILLPLAVITPIACWWAVRYTKRGKLAFHTLQLHVPLLGSMFTQLHLSRSMRMIGTMANAGVHLVECVATARDLCGNIHFQRLWIQVEQQLHEGKQMSEPLFASRLVPRSIAQMVGSAEKSGKLGPVMEQIAAHAEQELKERITELTRYIEPAMIVVMGTIIGGVAMALMLPVMTISRVMAQ